MDAPDGVSKKEAGKLQNRTGNFLPDVIEFLEYGSGSR